MTYQTYPPIQFESPRDSTQPLRAVEPNADGDHSAVRKRLIQSLRDGVAAVPTGVAHAIFAE
jgi:hypothetical protein